MRGIDALSTRVTVEEKDGGMVTRGKRQPRVFCRRARIRYATHDLTLEPGMLGTKVQPGTGNRRSQHRGLNWTGEQHRAATSPNTRLQVRIRKRQGAPRGGESLIER